MKKFTAMLLSLVMCFSLMAIPAQAAFIPNPNDPGPVKVGGTLIDPGDDDSEDPGSTGQTMRFPDPTYDVPIDD